MDREEFASRVRAIQQQLYRITFGLLREPADRMDAVQEAILKAWCNLPRLRDPALFETWLIRILINECRNRQRYQRRFVPTDAVPEPSAVSDDLTELRDAILALPENLRVPVMLHYMEGYKTDEIAQMLRIPTGTVRSRLRRARTLLKNLLDHSEGRPED